MPRAIEGYLIGNPGTGPRLAAVPERRHAAQGLRRRGRCASTTRSSRLQQRFANNWFFSANYTLSRLYGNYAGLASSDEISTPTTNNSSATAQQQAGSIARPGGNANREWDLDELLWDSHGNLDLEGRLATDRPHVVKLYGATTSPSARRSARSSTAAAARRSTPTSPRPTAPISSSKAATAGTRTAR